MPSVLTDMLAGRSACHLLLEDALHAAVLEPRPMMPGHAVVFPKKETDAVLDLPDAELEALLRFAKKVAAAQKAALPCLKIALVAYGVKVRHAHLHLLPVQGAAGEVDFAKQREVPAAELAGIAAKIRARL